MLKRTRQILAALFFAGITLLLLDVSGTLFHYLSWMPKVQLLPALLAANLAVVGVILALTLLLGRIYCSVICPLGVMQDLAARLNRKRNPYSLSPALWWLRLTALCVFVLLIVTGLTGVAALIAPYSSANSAFKSVRHRLMLDASYTYRFGDWQLSLKERLQATYRTGDMNEYQNPRTALTLKSRLKVQYKGLRRLTPYAYLELRNTLNAPVISAYYNESTGEYFTSEGSLTGDAGWFLEGFSGAYVNRVRGCLGAEYRLDRRSRLEAYLLLDRISDKQVDANAEGTKLKSYTRETGFVGWINIGYSYSF